MSASSKTSHPQESVDNHKSRPIIFLDIDGVLNTTKHNTQIHFETHLLQRLKYIVETTNAFIVLTTFWRHFHEYISYVFHRHKIDVGKHMLPLPMGTTRGKQSTKKFLHYHLIIIAQQENGVVCPSSSGSSMMNNESNNNNIMIGRSAEDDGEYTSRAEEIEAWLKMYGEEYMGSNGGRGAPNNKNNSDDDKSSSEYDFHSADWRYVILDDRSSAAKPGTPLFDRFVCTDTKLGLTEVDAEKAIRLLLFGP